MKFGKKKNEAPSLDQDLVGVFLPGIEECAPDPRGGFEPLISEKIPPRYCDTCPVNSYCPKASPGETCAFSSVVESNTISDPPSLLKAVYSLLELQLSRVKFAHIADNLRGNLDQKDLNMSLLAAAQLAASATKLNEHIEGKQLAREKLEHTKEIDNVKVGLETEKLELRKAAKNSSEGAGDTSIYIQAIFSGGEAQNGVAQKPIIRLPTSFRELEKAQDATVSSYLQDITQGGVGEK